MEIKETFKQIKVLLGVEKPEEIKLEEQMLNDGITVLIADSFEPGMNIFIKTETDNVALPIGSYELEDGRMLEVEEEGIISSIGEMEVEEEEVTEEVEEELSVDDLIDEMVETDVEASEEEVEQEVEETVEFVSVDVFNKFVEEFNSFKESLNLSKVELAEKETEIETLKTELSKQPATKKINHAPNLVNLNKGKKGKTTFDTILNRIQK